MSEVVQYRTKIRGVSINEICPCLILLSVYRNEVGIVKWYQEKKIISVENNTLNSFSLRTQIHLPLKGVLMTPCLNQHFFFSVSDLSYKCCSSIMLADASN